MFIILFLVLFVLLLLLFFVIFYVFVSIFVVQVIFTVIVVVDISVVADRYVVIMIIFVFVNGRRKLRIFMSSWSCFYITFLSKKLETFG